ncbi:hypothetical protein Zmor_011449 [Zophobas morio]|uniref:TIL domain-containing protein n=1 Tax=Zophobas morio TaxID=2755281 RepID=A0AA38IR45_9CUCU|nr:hypothetical protein Zmor_011449 [Zophobas morio]
MDYKFILFLILFSIIWKTSTAIECGENEEPTDCLDPCLPTCLQPYHVTCNFFVCNEGCQCKPGFLRSGPGESCIAPTECGAYCLENQEYTSCGSECPDTCTLRNQKCTDNCVMGCYCKKNYILDWLMGECILEESCFLAS